MVEVSNYLESVRSDTDSVDQIRKVFAGHHQAQQVLSVKNFKKEAIQTKAKLL
jgi:hypothetical protein